LSALEPRILLSGDGVGLDLAGESVATSGVVAGATQILVEEEFLGQNSNPLDAVFENGALMFDGLGDDTFVVSEGDDSNVQDVSASAGLDGNAGAGQTDDGSSSANKEEGASAEAAAESSLETLPVTNSNSAEAQTLAQVVFGPDILNTLASQLTESLTAANGPPSASVSVEQLTSNSLNGQHSGVDGYYPFGTAISFSPFKYDAVMVLLCNTA
jgi:hypothetical protein